MEVMEDVVKLAPRGRIADLSLKIPKVMLRIERGEPRSPLGNIAIARKPA